MTFIEADVVIIGAGFGGSLTALLARRVGLRPVLIERGKHPRFAIGESSTPLANLVLGDLAERYDLPRLRPLTHYGTWRRAYPDVTCGLKRGFSYFHHRAGEPFTPRDDHANELLVAANPDSQRGDTHWFREDVDHFLVREVQAAGIPYLDQAEIERIDHTDGWRLSLRRAGDPVHVAASFAVDASGPAGVIAKALGLSQDTSAIKTNSRTLYSHFRGVSLWEELYRDLGGSAGDHPFPCDAAALHHVFDGGWMWVLRFDNGITSAGFVLDRDRFGDVDEAVQPEQEWRSLLRRFPSIERQFEHAEAVQPFVRTSRLQRCAKRMAGADWAMLPHTACFVDPLHSPGNAHVLCGIEKLIRILAECPDAADRAPRLAAYEETIRCQARFLDRLIHGCFLSFARFELMSTFSMLYFAAATYSESRRMAALESGGGPPDDAFLCAGDPGLNQALARAYDAVCRLSRASHVSGEDSARYHEQVAQLIEPYNVAGLCDPAKGNMYPYISAC